MSTEQATVLIADDEPELLEIFAIWMSRSGYHVLTAANGAEALALLANTPVDAIISDIRMPVMDGLTLVRRIHEMKLLVPSIIFVSGFGDLDTREIYSLGVEAMLSKPLARDELIRALEASLTSRDRLWLLPAPQPVAETIEAGFEHLDQSTENRDFTVGRGGICVTTAHPIPEGTLVGLSIHFAREQALLTGQAIVRWYAAEERKMGLEFRYIAPQSRRWVLDAMRGKARFSYIPRC